MGDRAAQLDDSSLVVIYGGGVVSSDDLKTRLPIIDWLPLIRFKSILSEVVPGACRASHDFHA